MFAQFLDIIFKSIKLDKNLSPTERAMYKESIIESLMSIKRAGASAIVTYFALEIASKIKKI